MRTATARRVRTVGTWLVSAIIVVSAIVAILQFMGISNLSLFMHRVFAPSTQPTPTPPPSVATYQTAAPGCDVRNDPSYLRWYLLGADGVECPHGSQATVLNQGDRAYVGDLTLRADNRTFTPNETISLVVENLRAGTCAGVESRQHASDSRGYAFYICGGGNWYIIKYSAAGGTPLVLRRSAAEERSTITPVTTLVATLSGNSLQLVVNNGPAYTATDADFTDTEQVSINWSGEDTLETYLPSHILASITVTGFYYAVG